LAKRCTADPGPPRPLTVPGPQRTVTLHAALRPGHDAFITRWSFDLLAHEVEPLERRLVRHHEEVGIAAACLMAREGPMRDREYVMLRPLEGLFAVMRAALARGPEADHVVGRAFLARGRAAAQARRIAIKRRQDGAAGRRIDVADHAHAVGAGGRRGEQPAR